MLSSFIILSWLSVTALSSPLLLDRRQTNAASIDEPPIVIIRNGTVIGKNVPAMRQQQFLGIPYAQPPIGNLRLRQAVPLNSSFGSLNATAFGDSCISRTSDSPNPSEDCLTLNVIRAMSTTSTSTLPVFVYFYGGGLTAGYTADARSNGFNMVQQSVTINKPIVFVSINYRLGPLGFLNGRQMAELDLLNIGMKDQRLALFWLQDNIAAFGGDPQKVTLFGQSAGAVSIYSHLTAYGGRDDGLFRGGILMSGGAFPLTLPNTTAFQAAFDSLVVNSTCASTLNKTAQQQLDCIRTLSTADFLAKAGKSTGQVIDGDFTQTSIRFSVPAGKFIRVPMMVGTTTDEGTTSAPTGINTTQELFGPLSQGYFRPVLLSNDSVDHLLSSYSQNPVLGCPYNTGATILTMGGLDKMACSIFGDLVQIGPARFIAQQLTQFVPLYRYRFNYFPTNGSITRGVTTGSDINFAFRSELLSSNRYDQALSNDMSSAFISFAYNQNPNPGINSTLPYWPTYGANASTMVFNAPGSYIETDDYRQDNIQYIIDHVLPYGAK